MAHKNIIQETPISEQLKVKAQSTPEFNFATDKLKGLADHCSDNGLTIFCILVDKTKDDSLSQTEAIVATNKSLKMAFARFAKEQPEVILEITKGIMLGTINT